VKENQIKYSHPTIVVANKINQRKNRILVQVWINILKQKLNLLARINRRRKILKTRRIRLKNKEQEVVPV
jgi:hypothetical protein